MSRRAIIVSDVHLTWEGPDVHLGKPCLLPKLIERLAEGTDTELVLAGDVFDFLEERDYAGWEPDKAKRRMVQVLTKNPKVVKALHAFTEKQGNQVTLLCGNHDPEVGLPDVRESFAETIGLDVSRLGGEELLTNALPPPAAPLYGRSLFECRAWVLHGDRWDHFNRIDRKVLREQHGALRLPPGSRLVYQVLRDIKQSYPWAYYLKLSNAALFILLLLTAPKLVLQRLGGNAPLSWQLFQTALKKSIVRHQVLGPEPDGDTAPEAQGPLVEVLAAAVAQEIFAATESDQERKNLLYDLVPVLQQALQEQRPISRMPHMLSLYPSANAFLEKVLRPAELTKDNHPDIPFWQSKLSHMDDLGDRFQLLPEPTSVLIAGHTHGPCWREADGRLYVNSGTWIPVGHLRQPALTSALRLAREPPLPERAAEKDPVQERAEYVSGSWSAEVPATYVEITEEGTVTLSRLTEKGESIEVKRGKAWT